MLHPNKEKGLSLFLILIFLYKTTTPIVEAESKAKIRIDVTSVFVSINPINSTETRKILMRENNEENFLVWYILINSLSFCVRSKYVITK